MCFSPLSPISNSCQPPPRVQGSGYRRNEEVRAGLEGCGAGRWRDSGRKSPVWPPLARVWLTLVAGPRSASRRLRAPPPGRRGPRGRVRRRRRPAGAKARPSAGLIGSGREGARSRRAGPVSAAPCRSAGGGKRGARGGRAAAAPPSRPRRLWPGLRGVSERGRRRGAGRGRRR